MTLLFRHGFTVNGPTVHGKCVAAPVPTGRGPYCRLLARRRACFARRRLRKRQMRLEIMQAVRREAQMRISRSLTPFLPRPLLRRGFDPELLYVECGRCGAPVMWEKGRTTRILEQAGIDRLELDPTCMLVTDHCPMCGDKGQYTVQIFRLSRGSEAQQPPSFGHA